MNAIKFTTEREIDDDTYIHHVTATRGGLTGKGEAWTPERAMQRAIADLTRKARTLSPVSPNWENTPEAFLTRN